MENFAAKGGSKASRVTPTARILIIAGPADVLAEQLDAEGRPVWRHAGPPLEVVERLRDVPRPGELGAPTRPLSESRELLPGSPVRGMQPKAALGEVAGSGANVKARPRHRPPG